LHLLVYIHQNVVSTECGRKNSPILEADKFKIKEDTANVFLFLERTQNGLYINLF